MSDFIDEAISKMQEDGLNITKVIADGQLHRCPIEGKPRGKDGAYKIYTDIPQTAWWRNWVTDTENTYTEIPQKMMSAADKREFKRRMEANKKTILAEQQKRYAATAKEAQKRFKNADVATNSHPYLARKKVLVFGELKINSAGELLIPLLDERGKIQSYQRILPEKPENGPEKPFLKGGKTAGGYFHISAQDGAKDGPLLIAEGYATAASAHMATGYAALVAFSADNLLAVAKMARRRYPKRNIIILADFDVSKSEQEKKLFPNPGGKGVAKATEAANEINAYLSIPPSPNGDKIDFNDIHCFDDLDSVRTIIDETLKNNLKTKKPSISYRPGEIPKAISELEKILQGYVFQNGGRLVNIIKLPNKKSYGKFDLEANTPVINPLDADALSALANRYANWEKFDVRTEKYIPANAPQPVIREFAASKGFWNLPQLEGLITCPVIRFNGTILNKSGYDEHTGFYATFDQKSFPGIPENPDYTMAVDAISLLIDAISEFPFKTDVDRSVALAAMLTTALRQAVPHAPLFAFSAPCPGTGKSALANMISILATGKEAPAFNYSPDPDEMKKALFSILSTGTTTLLIDNVRGIVNNPVLNIVTSQSEMTDRVLGQNTKTITVGTRAIIMATGNNLTFADDMTRRTMYAVLDANEERPAERKFNRTMPDWAIEHRPQLIAAVITILRAFHLAGYPGAKELKPLNGFEKWGKWIRGALVWLGEKDPLESQRQIEASDPERETFENVLSAWWECYQDKPVLVRELLRQNGDESGYIANEKIELHQAILATAKTPNGLNPKSFGWWLRNHEGRIVGGFQLVKGEEYQKMATWIVKKI